MRKTSVLPAAILLLLSSACERPNRTEVERAATLTSGGDARLGKTEIRKYGCNACHEISGVAGAQGLIGPSLDGIGQRYYIAGELPNTPGNLMLWIQHPAQWNPIPQCRKWELPSRIAATLRRICTPYDETKQETVMPLFNILAYSRRIPGTRKLFIGCLCSESAGLFEASGL